MKPFRANKGAPGGAPPLTPEGTLRIPSPVWARRKNLIDATKVGFPPRLCKNETAGHLSARSIQTARQARIKIKDGSDFDSIIARGGRPPAFSHSLHRPEPFDLASGNG
jgi:hypothetical protein